MDLLDIIRAEKTDVSVGAWGTGHIPKAQFPIPNAKAKHYKFGNEYRWRVVKFDCLNTRCRVLILLCEPRLIFRATLAVEVEGDLCIVCDHEFHADEPGWHCHLTSNDVASVLEDVRNGARRSHMRRWPKAGTNHSRIDFNVTESSALTIAAERFRFVAQGSLF